MSDQRIPGTYGGPDRGRVTAPIPAAASDHARYLVALDERDAALARVERLREALQNAHDALSMVVGLPDFQIQHPEFAAGIRHLLAGR